MMQISMINVRASHTPRLGQSYNHHQILFLLTYHLSAMCTSNTLILLPLPSVMSTSKPGGNKREVGERKVSDQFYNEEGDMVIISSDEVAFKTPGFRLQSTSEAHPYSALLGC
jgi:hypothetical protein